MADTSKFTVFLEKAADRLDQIKQSLLKHEKNPNDREFINDIFRSVHAIKNGALPVGLGRISELCFHLENFLQRIRQERLKINREKIDILIAGCDRLEKLLHDITTRDKERSTIKDLLKRIQDEMEAVPETVVPEAAAPEAVSPEAAPTRETPLPPETGSDLDTLFPALTTAPSEPFSEEEDASSLLPDEIRNQEYDQELFQIFVEQMQENLSLLRALTNGYATSANKGKSISLCSDLVGKLQTSANYMGYERLADYYIQWVAELEMAGVELSMGTPVSLDFMEERIGTITELFPQVTDTPAAPAAVRRAEEEMVPPQPVAREKAPAPGVPAETEFFKDLFSDMEEGGEEAFAPAGPIAALSGFAEPREEKPPAQPATAPAARKKRITTSVAIDSTFLDEERQSPEFDEELFQIFVQQLRENLSELRTLVDSYPKAANKATIVNQCSTLVGKLQSSANYMGYEPLAEYYLQWIAELEMAGVDLSLGTPVSLSFMEEKIGKITEIFPQVRDLSAPVQPGTIPEPIPSPRPEPAAKEPDEGESFKELFTGMDDEEEDSFPVDSAPVAALTGFAEEEGWMEPGLTAEADLPEVDDFFSDQRGAPAGKSMPSPGAAYDVEKLFSEEEDVPASEPVAALTGTENIADWQEPVPTGGEALSEVDEFFGALGVELPDLTPKPAPAPPEPAYNMENLFAGTEDAEASEPVAGLPAGEEPVETLASVPEEAVLPEIDNFFRELAEGEEESFEIGAEPIAALTGEAFSPDISGPPAAPPVRHQPVADIEALFQEEEEALPAGIKQEAEDIESLFAATAGGDDLDFEAEDDTLVALADSAAADLTPAAKPPASERKIAPPAEDLASLFGEEEEFPAPEEPAGEAVSAPPERQELFRKLSDALKSLDEEVPTLEAAIDKSRARAAIPASLAPSPPQRLAEVEEQNLFARLLGALEATAEDDDRGAAKPIDQVIEEILAGEGLPPSLHVPGPEELPPRITIPDVRPQFGLDAERMDSLMDRIGELAVSRTSLSQLHREISTLHHHLQERHALDAGELTPLQDLLLRLEDTTTVLGRVAGEIREGILKVRMIPAGQLFSLYQEVAADLAKKAGRQIQLSIRGEDTEIDQFTAGDIGDCLLHLLSNAITHGIEPGEERGQLGKKVAGTVTLKACHEGNHAVIEVADDGRGIDPRLIKMTALARDMFSGNELFTMSDQDLTRLLTTPGFTTAAGASPDSMVPGLDRVKAIMDKLNGTVQIKSTVGQGTRVRLLVPLKLPTFQALKVKAGTEVYALPLSSVEEIIRATPENLIQADDAELIAYRHANIPLHSLGRLAGLETPPHRERFPVVVVNTDEGPAGLGVDEMIGLEEVPVRQVAAYLREHHDFTGTAIIDEGDFSFIPDVAALMHTATGEAGIRP